jgi:hypothetical protein
MRRFTDSTGRCWRLKLDLDALERIRTLAGIDLLDSTGRDFAALLHHPTTFTAILFAAVEPDAYARDVTEEAFLDAMGAAACEQALPLFAGEFGDFFPPPRAKPPKQSAKPVEAWQSVRRLAGVAGVSPGPHTLRELVDMAEGRERSEWRRTAQVLALLYNAHFKGDKTPEDFYPFKDVGSAAPPLKISMAMLAPVFVKEAQPQ